MCELFTDSVGCGPWAGWLVRDLERKDCNTEEDTWETYMDLYKWEKDVKIPVSHTNAH